MTWGASEKNHWFHFDVSISMLRSSSGESFFFLISKCLKKQNKNTGPCVNPRPGLGNFLDDTKHKHPQIYIKLTRCKDNDGRKLPIKYYLSIGAVVIENRFTQINLVLVRQNLFYHVQ